MTLKVQFTRAASNFSLVVFVLAAFFLHDPASALTGSHAGNTLPGFTDFVAQVQNGEADVLRGVYVPGVLALPVTQQPENDPNYVSGKNGQATQFATASQYGNVGLLAHNYLSGKSFSQLAVGQEVRLVYGSGKVEYFVVKEVLRFQALQPKSAWSEFRDMASDEVLSVQQMFNRVYAGDRHVTFQTCIQAYGNWSWGRLFVVATPLP
ncbi:MAG TPA: hypothetical protein VI524_14330 [Anaerolineales bacterium]|nr:hypothetical protein [Anaerolineales bacterium]